MLQVKPSWRDWRLLTKNGRHLWAYKPGSDELDGHLTNSDNITEKEIARLSEDFYFDKSKNPNAGDQVFRNQAINASFKAYAGKIPLSKNPQEQSIIDALVNGIHFFSHLQSADGHWPGDYGGPMFLLPGLIIASYITATPFPKSHRAMMQMYLFNHQDQDGGWGMHIEGNSSMFGTVMQYVSLRILGVAKADLRLSRARVWIKANGGATSIPSWGKFYLSLLNLYEWHGFNSLFPEMWLMPKWLPVHPWRYWCHSRLVYLPMAYCYGKQIKMPENDLIVSLRSEIFNEDFAAINWSRQRNKVCEKDSYTVQSPVLKVMNFFTNSYEKFKLAGLRNRTLNYILDYLNAEDEQTAYLDIGPVSQAINSICIWHAYGKDSEQFKQHVARWFDYLWIAEDGMKMSGYNGSQFWDVAFATRAVLESDIAALFPRILENSYHFIELSQILKQHPTHEQYFRHPMIGSWPFSTAEQGWPVADCTAEGLSAALNLHQSGRVNPVIGTERIHSAVDVILSYQNSDGGWATYELSRAPKWLEMLNPSEVFADIMIDYSWTECSSACVQCLLEFHELFPAYKPQHIKGAISNGLKFILAQQKTDGSWYGGWAVCFTYATWFGVEALCKAKGRGYVSEQRIASSVGRAVAFLLAKQKTDGGWGETFESCSKRVYSEAKEAQVVNTSWALLTLMAAEYGERGVIARGIRLLLSRQNALGDWQQENISGVFNYNCMISYSNYRNIFPIWALNRYYKKFLC